MQTNLNETMKNREKFNFESFVIDNYTNDDVIKYAFVGLGQGGGKISIDFNLMNYYVSLFNTAKSDLGDAIQTLSENNKTPDDEHDYLTPEDKYFVDGSNYKVTPFGTLGGAKKDRYFGKEAVVGNFDLLKRRLVSDQNISCSDFVWVAASLGGGTASGSVTDIVRIISGFIRKGKKRFGYREATKIQRALPGTPTVGVIALWPEESSSPKVKLNAAEALQELHKLHQEGLLGNIILIDNQMLLDEAIKNNIDDWQKYCNARIVQLLTEASVLTSINSDTSVDRAELMEVITQPGFQNISKTSFCEQDIFDDVDKNTLKRSINVEKCKKLASEIVSKTHFTDSYSNEDALRTIFMTLSQDEHPTYNKTTFYTLQSEIAKVQNSAIVHHQGMYKTKSMVKANQQYNKMILNQSHATVKLDNSKEIIAYYMCVYKHMPAKYLEIAKTAIEKRDYDLKKIRERDDSLSSFNFHSIDDEYIPNVSKSDNFDEFAQEIENSMINEINPEADSFDDFLNSSDFGSSSDIYDVTSEDK